MPLNLPTIANFNQAQDIEEWQIVDDEVMGGRSAGQLHYHSAGYAIFSGQVSLANGGGFSSVQYAFRQQQVGQYGYFRIRLKGDGKKYQFRVKSEKTQRGWYVYNFETTGEWQELKIDMAAMQPQFRGQKLDEPNYRGRQLAAVAFLIANKQEQDFKLQIDEIELLNQDK